MAKASKFKKFGKKHPELKVSTKEPYDKINPKHYKSSHGIEVMDVIEIWNLDYPLGAAVKYILREGKKPDEDAIIDLEKAVWYLKRKIGSLKGMYPKVFTDSADGPITSQALRHRRLPSTSLRKTGRKSGAQWKGNRRK